LQCIPLSESFTISGSAGLSSGRAVGEARQYDSETLLLPCASESADRYFIGFDGRTLFRGNDLKDPEALQAGFRRAMAEAGRGGAHGFTVTADGRPVYAEKDGEPVAPGTFLRRC